MFNRTTVPESELTVHLIEDRRAVVSPWGKGNSKLGPGVYTYSRLPGKIEDGTCPGATPWCLSKCYAFRLLSNPPVRQLLFDNTWSDSLPSLPDDASLVRIHVSGDFDTRAYIYDWIELALHRKDVTFWGYTRSWRVGELYDALCGLRSLPNVHLFASMDPDCYSVAPMTWRRAWIAGDERLRRISGKRYMTPDQRPAIVCPEESGALPNCVECGFCFGRQRAKHDLVFLEH